jgi:hypothetical protein
MKKYKKEDLKIGTTGKYQTYLGNWIEFLIKENTNFDFLLGHNLILNNN